MQKSWQRQTAKATYLRELRENGTLDKLFRLGLVSSSAYTLLEAFDLYEVHLQVCPNEPLKMTAEAMGMSRRRIRQILHGK